MNPGESTAEERARRPAARRELKLLPTLEQARSPLSSAEAQRARLDALDLGAGGDFEQRLDAAGLSPLRATGIEVLQLNVGRLCNQTCAHCHVDAGPTRQEVMSRETAELCMHVLAQSSVPTVDITGGAPEMCPSFEYLVAESRRLGRHVLDRCNLTILCTEKYAHLPRFLAEHDVEVVCSLPHYRQYGTDRQRGDGVFERSLEGLRRLNEHGYGDGSAQRRLVLVTNPVGAFLPRGSKAALEAEWRRELDERYGIRFDELISITNMPISRYLEWLTGTGNLEGYMHTLTHAFNPAAARGVMCRTTLSVGWRGELYDCDFNQMLELEVESGVPRHLSDFDAEALASRRIVTGRHCFGCTAGAGSSCGGRIAE